MNVFTKKVSVTEDFHGMQVSDPYRWLEDSQSAEVDRWVDEQNEQTEKYIGTYADKEKVKSELTRLHNYTKYSTPQREGEYYYFHKNDGLQNQPVFCRSKSLDMKNVEVVIDPNTLNDKGTAALTDVFFNSDGSLMAYAVSFDGSDWQHVQIMDMNTKKVFPELLEWCKFCQITWDKDSKGFYYDRYPNPNTVDPTEESYYNKVFYHTLGTEQADDVFIYDVPNKKEYAFSPRLSDDKKYLILEVNNGTEPRNRIHYKKLGEEKSFIPLIDEADAYYSFLGNDGTTFYFQTNVDAPKGKVIAVDIDQPEREHWKVIIPEGDHALSFVQMVHDSFVVCKTVDVCSTLEMYDRQGNFIKSFEFPQSVTIQQVSGNRASDKMLVAYHSFLHPVKIVEYDFTHDQQRTVLESEVAFDEGQYETTQVFYPSKDGTKIPMFLVHKKGLALDGNNPVLLYSYGGYGMSMTPSFSPAQILWLEAGGIYAVANIRGGGEYGEDWHSAAIFEKRQNSFDDFAAAAEWLIEQNYSTPNKIAISGASNGGLLVAVSITQRPDLFGAALSLVPVTDMLRFHHFTVGRFWTTEFGNAEKNKEDFDFLYAYSPLHNVQEGESYPATLITTADTDDRVVPLHAYKFAATLQAGQGGEQPVLLRVEKNAGHGLGKPISKIIEEETDIYTFLFQTFSMSIK